MADKHVKAQIRDSAVAAVTGLTTTGTRVYSGRVWPMTSGTMPGLCVYTGDERGVEEDESANILVKEMDIVIDGYVSGSSIDDVADNVQLEVETALYGTRTGTDENPRYFGGKALELIYKSSGKKYDGEASTPFMIIRMIYAVRYAIRRGIPQTAL
jgi:hypothetical protein